MNEQKKVLTGYPSIDKPWLRYYSEEAINTQIPQCTIYEYLYENNKVHLNETAINYVGRWITYGELFQNIDKVANAFVEEGICEGDIVTIIAPSIPEIIYSFYALNKIGAVSNFIDPRKSEEEVEELLANMPTKACIVLDNMWEKFYGVLDKQCSLFISVSIADSLAGLPKLVMKLKTQKLNSKINELRELMVKHAGARNDVKAPFKRNSLALLEYTGGTTGISKGVMLSNENVNSDCKR